MNHWAKHFQNYDLFMNNFSAYRDSVRFHVVQQEDAGHILDDGCGTGNLTLALLAKGHRVSAIDPEISIIDLVTSKCANFENSLDVQKMDGQNLKFADNYFDGINSMFVIPFIENNEKYVSEMFRVLKPGGHAIISAWAPRQDILTHIACKMEVEFMKSGILPKYETNWREFLETSRVNTEKVKASYNSTKLQSDLRNAGFVNIIKQTSAPYGGYAYFITCTK